MVAGLLGLAVIAHAAISSIQPSSGQGEPGEAVSAVVSVNSSGITSCLTATANITLVITFDQNPTCGTGSWSTLMQVVIPAVTPPGSYTVTVNETSLLGGSLLTRHSWPLQVTAPATTTTLLPEVTLFPTTTIATTTTITAATTTTGGGPTSTTIPDSPSTTIVIREATTSTEAEGLTPPTTTPPLGGQASPSIALDTPATGEPPPDDPEATFSEIAVSSGLIDVADRALPPVFAQAILSPMVLLEVLLRALGRTGSGLLIPLGVTIVAGFALTRRLRHDAEEVPELDEFIEIPSEGDDRR